MPRIEPVHMQPFRVTLAIDALYLNAARQAVARAESSRRNVAEARRSLILLEREEAELREVAESGSTDARDALHDLAIQIVNGAQPELEHAYAPYLEDLAVVHVTAVAAVEAHLNALGKDLLGKTLYAIYERLSIEGKWLFLPSLCGGRELKPSDHRYAMLSKAVRFRNELVHYKTKQEDWREGRPPLFIAQLGLQLGAARRSLRAAEAAIRAVCEALDRKIPYWIEKDTGSYFELVRDEVQLRPHGT